MSDANTRRCKCCQKVLPISDFVTAGVKGGKKYHRHICRKCYRKNANDRRLTIRAIFCEWKKTLCCSKCGFDDYRALHFHHHDGCKEANIADLVSSGASMDTIYREASKCIVLCANCHAIEHSN